MPSEATNFQQPGAVERLFGRALVALVRIGLVRGHFFVLEVRGRKTGKSNLAAGGPDRDWRKAVPGLRPRRVELGAQCPLGRRNRACACDAAPAVCRARAAAEHAAADPQSLSRPLCDAKCSASSRCRRARRWKLSMSWRRATRSSSCSRWTRPHPRPERRRAEVVASGAPKAGTIPRGR